MSSHAHHQLDPVPKPATLLPLDARSLLIAAAREKDEYARARAIDAATEHIKLRYPMYFQPTPQL